MPVIKTEIGQQARANVAYVAAMLGEPEHVIYGRLLDHFAGGTTPDKLTEVARKVLEKGSVSNGIDSKDTQ